MTWVATRGGIEVRFEVSATPVPDDGVALDTVTKRRGHLCGGRRGGGTPIVHRCGRHRLSGPATSPRLRGGDRRPVAALRPPPGRHRRPLLVDQAVDTPSPIRSVDHRRIEPGPFAAPTRPLERLADTREVRSRWSRKRQPVEAAGSDVQRLSGGCRGWRLAGWVGCSGVLGGEFGEEGREGGPFGVG